MHLASVKVLYDNRPQFGGKFCDGESREYDALCNTDVCILHIYVDCIRDAYHLSTL